MLSLALDPGRSGFRPTVIRVRKTKSAIARNDQRDALFQRPHAAIVPDVVPDVFYRAPGTLVGSARADVEQNGRCDRHYDEYELHGSSPIGQRAVSLPDTSRASDKKDSTPQYVRRLLHAYRPPVTGWDHFKVGRMFRANLHPNLHLGGHHARSKAQASRNRCKRA